MTIRRNLLLAAALVLLAPLAAPLAAQSGTKPADDHSPSATLADALAAACRQKVGEFAQYLPEASAEAYRNLPEVQQHELMRRLVAVREAGHPLLSTSNEGLPVLRCSSPSETTELRMSRERVQGNLAFVTAALPSGLSADFGLVREPGGWRLISLGLLMLNIPELAKEWAVQDTLAREQVAVDQMHRIASAVDTYQKAFGRLPDSLAQLGPAPQDGVSPDAANLIDAELASGTKANYSFHYRVYSSSRESDVRYEIIATPIQYGPGGKRSFYLDSNGVLRGADKKADVAGPDDPRLDDHLEEIREP
ncbi:MAG TPA: hypothetical protein VLW54_01965 [Candidatus Acidoferrales bacterium]|nr:hypothetical protein [Candidatus Acidoferrales bacterium]